MQFYLYQSKNKNYIVFEPENDKPYKMACVPSEDRSAWACTQSDQGRRCPHEERLGPELPIEFTVKTPIRLGGCQD